jgi:two-component system, response regulator
MSPTLESHRSAAARILLVEDDPDDVEMILATLTKHCPENRILVARDGATAIGYVQRGDLARDVLQLVVLDWKLPMGSGLDVLRAVRTNPGLQRVPVVVLTSSRHDRDLADAYAAGANSYLCKPFDLADFEALVDHLGQYWTKLNEHSSS